MGINFADIRIAHKRPQCLNSSLQNLLFDLQDCKETFLVKGILIYMKRKISTHGKEKLPYVSKGCIMRIP